MSFSIASSGSSSNPSLAWVMGNRGKGRMLIKFPLPLDKGWYHEQPCTTFHTLEHRKERSGFQHEFIVLKLLDGSACRIERMGDPDARFEALSPHGTVAHDMMQCFRPDEIDQARLGTSNIIAEIRLPCDFDIMDVLKICRAIQEGEKTCNYTLQVFNCFFFSLAIQVCLVRLVAQWESQDSLGSWLLHVHKGVKALESTLKSDTVIDTHSLHRIYSVLASGDTSLDREVMRKLQDRWKRPNSIDQQKHLSRHVNKVLWSSDIHLGLKRFVEDQVRQAMMDALKEITIATHINIPNTRANLVLLLVELVAPNCPKDVPLNQHKSSSSMGVVELSFMKVQASRAEEISGNWFQWMASSVTYIWSLVLWALITVLIPWRVDKPLLKVDTAQRRILDQILRSIATDLEALGSIHRSKLKAMKALVQGNLGVAAWDQNPWATMCHLVTRNFSENILEDVDSNQPRLNLCVKTQSILSGVSVSAFQDHIFARIKTHAELVQSIWLGSAVTIEAELKSTLSQVWGLIREDDALISKGIFDESNSSNPLINPASTKNPSQRSTTSHAESSLNAPNNPISQPLSHSTPGPNIASAVEPAVMGEVASTGRQPTNSIAVNSAVATQSENKTEAVGELNETNAGSTNPHDSRGGSHLHPLSGMTTGTAPNPTTPRFQQLTVQQRLELKRAFHSQNGIYMNGMMGTPPIQLTLPQQRPQWNQAPAPRPGVTINRMPTQGSPTANHGSPTGQLLSNSQRL